MLNPWSHDVVPIHGPFYNRVPQAISIVPIDVMIDPDAMSADELDLNICLSFCGPPAQTSMAHTRFKRRGNQPFLVTVDFRSTDVIISAREPVMVMVLLLGLALRLATLASLKQGGLQRLQRTDTFMMRLH